VDYLAWVIPRPVKLPQPWTQPDRSVRRYRRWPG